MEQELWKEVEDFPKYYISNHGNVFSSIRKRKMILSTNGRYYRVSFSDNNGGSIENLVHRLVAKAFVANPNNYNIVNHLDGNKLNNYYKNLRWSTGSENIKHSYRLGLNSGKRNFGELELLQIRLALLNNIPTRQIAKTFSIGLDTLAKIKKGEIK